MAGRKCRECGCTQFAACFTFHGETCGWAKQDLCTACADPGDQEWHQVCPDCRGRPEKVVQCERCDGIGEFKKAVA